MCIEDCGREEKQDQIKAFGFNLFVEKSLFSRRPPPFSLPSNFLSFIQIPGLVLRRVPGCLWPGVGLEHEVLQEESILCDNLCLGLSRFIKTILCHLLRSLLGYPLVQGQSKTWTQVNWCLIALLLLG